MSRDTIPGRNLALGTTLALVSLAVIVPLAAVVLSLNGITPEHLVRAIASPSAIAAFRLTFVASLVAALIDLLLGSFVAWILVRYRFPGRPILDALVDVPLAIPTAVTGITLATIYGGHGFLGAWLEPHGIHIAYTQVGVALALVFVGFPFVVRTVQPVLAEIPKDLEEAAASFGAGQLLTLGRVILPLVFPAMLTAFAGARTRRVRLGRLHRRQPAGQDRARAAADHHPPRGVRLPRRFGGGDGPADRIVRHALGDQRHPAPLLARA